MTAPYNLTNVTGANNWADLIIGTNLNLMDGMFGTMVIITIFFMLFFGFKQFEFKKAFAASAWITGVLTTFLALLQIVSTYTVVAVWVVAALSLALLILKND